MCLVVQVSEQLAMVFANQATKLQKYFLRVMPSVLTCLVDASKMLTHLCSESASQPTEFLHIFAPDMMRQRVRGYHNSINIDHTHLADLILH